MELMRAMAVAAAVVVLVVTVPPAAPRLASGQVVAAAMAACTESLLTSFTPCLAFIVSNGTNGGRSWSPPSADCCRGLAAVVNVSTSCAKLFLAGQAAVGIQVNCTLAVALPKKCNSTISVSLECKGEPRVEVQPRGPAAAAAPPTKTPSSPQTATTSKAPAPALKAPSPALPPPPSQGPPRSSAWRHGGRVSVLPVLAVMLGVGVGGAMIA